MDAVMPGLCMYVTVCNLGKMYIFGCVILLFALESMCAQGLAVIFFPKLALCCWMGIAVFSEQNVSVVFPVRWQRYSPRLFQS